MKANPRPPADMRLPLVVLTIAAAGLLIIASLSKSWLTNSGTGDMGFGPTGMRGCLIGVECDITSNGDAVAWLRKHKDIVKQVRQPKKGEPATSASGWFSPLGYLSFAATMLGAIGLLVTAVLAYRRERPELPFSPARFGLGALLIGLLAGGLFLVSKPGWYGLLGIGWGFWIFTIGVVAGIAGAQGLAKLIRPIDPLDAMIPEHHST